MICTLMPSTSGRATMMGKGVSKDPIAVKASIGPLPETPSVYESPTTEENLNYFCEMYQVPKSERAGRIDGLPKTFGLEGRRSFKVEPFPKGKKQKLALARTLVH